MGNLSVLVDVHLDQVDALLLALGHHIGSDGLAGSAPGGVEINKTAVSILELFVELCGGVSVVRHLKISSKINVRNSKLPIDI